MKKNVRGVDRVAERLPVWTRGVGEHIYDFDRYEVLFGAEAIDRAGGGLPGVLDATRLLRRNHPVFLGLLSDVLGNSDRPLRNRYLDVTAAIEAFDTQVRGVGPVSEPAFKTARKALAGASAADASDVKFLKRWLSRRAASPLSRG